MAAIPGISNFHRTIALHRAACDYSESGAHGTRFSYFYVESADSYIKIERDTVYHDSPAIRGAIAWAIRRPHRQITIFNRGQVYLE